MAEISVTLSGVSSSEVGGGGGYFILLPVGTQHSTCWTGCLVSNALNVVFLSSLNMEVGLSGTLAKDAHLESRPLQLCQLLGNT